MNREKKFRAMRDDISNPAFVYGDLIYSDGVPRITNDGGLTFYTCINGTEGQYTGLKDKNGKEIYEGDIVKWDDNSNGKYWRVAVVIWQQGFAFNIVENTIHELSCEVGHIFKLQNFIYSNDGELAVIGNIHENANLINS